MGKFLTSPAVEEQLPEKGMYRLLTNELYQDDDNSIYLAWRGFQTDNFTWINSSDYDTRCSHIHDVGCKYHQLVRVLPDFETLRKLGIVFEHEGKTFCMDLPPEYLKVVDITGHEVNNLFYRMLRDADCPKTPKAIQYLYRAGVCFNFGWFKEHEEIDLNSLYGDD